MSVEIKNVAQMGQPEKLYSDLQPGDTFRFGVGDRHFPTDYLMLQDNCYVNLRSGWRSTSNEQPDRQPDRVVYLTTIECTVKIHA